MSLETKLPAGWSRRAILKGGAALGAGLAAAPMLGRSAFAQDEHTAVLAVLRAGRRS